MTTEPTRIVFFGTPAFAVPSLRVLREHGTSIVAAVTAPDKPRGRGQQVTFTPVKATALEYGIPVMQPERLDDRAFITALSELRADLFVVVAFRILPREVFTLPRLGSFNLHASLLPRYRGAAPINWAIINGDRETGVTTFLLEDKVDTGGMLLQARVAIGPEMTAGELHDVLAEVGAEITAQTVHLFASGRANARAQDHSLATPAPKIFREDCRLDWAQPASTLANRVRGLSPVPTAWTTSGDDVLKVYRAHVADAPSSSLRAGSVVASARDRCLVQTGSGVLSLDEVMLEGRKRLVIGEFLRGHPLAPGTILGS